MNNAMIACKTIEDEVIKALECCNKKPDLAWIESGLHNTPELLKKTIQEKIETLDGKRYLLLAFGLCGNALLGLKAQKATLVVPRVDDCISLFLGGNQNRRALEREARAYYLTRGWLRYENNIRDEYEKSLTRYGREKTNRLFTVMLKHYTDLTVIDTGAYDLDSFQKETTTIAAALGLRHRVIQGETTILDDLVAGRWQQHCVLIKPGQAITLKDMNSCFPA